MCGTANEYISLNEFQRKLQRGYKICSWERKGDIYKTRQP